MLLGPAEARRYTRAMTGGSSSPSARMRIALDLFELAEMILRQKLRRTRPGDSETEVEAAVRAWRAARPGAERGDAPGRSRS